ncbi:MAG: hypothetical protein M1817_002466 [Caeruleum heppii]|nr:MAG: hypothetical protein M1817_002466 [Caeruleum heppii]
MDSSTSEKGKERALKEDQLGPDNSHNSPPSASASTPSGRADSLTSRITASASDLAQSFTSPSVGASLSSSLATAQHRAGKSSSASVHHPIDGPSASADAPGSSATRILTSGASRTESFRNNSAEAHRNRLDLDSEFEAFATSPYAPTAISRPLELPRTDSSQSLSSLPDYGVHEQHHESHNVRPKRSYLPHPSVPDGTAVLDILDSSNYSTLVNGLDEPTQSATDDAPATSSTDLFFNDIPPDALSSLEDLKGRLPTPPTHSAPSPSNPLNLIPNGLLEDRIIGSDLEIDAFRASQLDTWAEILSRYSDVVWGDLLPLVTEARQELLERGEAGQAHRSPLENEKSAVRRLEMLLRHLKSRSQ